MLDINELVLLRQGSTDSFSTVLEPEQNLHVALSIRTLKTRFMLKKEGDLVHDKTKGSDKISRSRKEEIR